MGISLVVNPGSSTKKYAFYKNEACVVTVSLAKVAGVIEMEVQYDTKKEKTLVSEEEFVSSLKTTLHYLEEKDIVDISFLKAIGVRTVLPGKKFQSHQIVDQALLKYISSHSYLAPLHVPPLLEELRAVQSIFPEVTTVAVSDSAFHSSLPESSYRYSIDENFYTEHEVRRYGYHGLSVQSVVRMVGERNVFPGRNYIVCHIGSGVSLTAIQNGVSIDTTMGFTPGSGMVMASRSGDIESGALLEMMRIKNFSVSDMQQYIQTKGGLYALAGEADFRHIIERYACGDEVAIRALKVFTHSFKKHFGGLVAVLGILDGVVITGTAGERSSVLRELCFSQLKGFTIQVDKEKNEQLCGQAGFFHAEGTVPLYVCRTREMDEVARIITSY